MTGIILYLIVEHSCHRSPHLLELPDVGVIRGPQYEQKEPQRDINLRHISHDGRIIESDESQDWFAQVVHLTNEHIG